ncbi:MAG: ABC transporter permease [Candidatus Saccharimonadales bacterium]
MENFRKSLLPVTVFARIAVKRVFRDKTALFFTFAFPLIFLFVFGGIFSKNTKVNFKVALINQSKSQFSRQFADQTRNNPIFKVSNDITTLDSARDKMSKGQLDGAIVLPSDFGNTQGQNASGQAKIYYTQNNQQAGQALSSILESEFKDINSTIVHTTTPFTVVTEQTNDKTLSQFDYTFAGLLGFSIIGLGIFGPVNIFPELKKQGVLRRLHTTPLRVWQYFVANVISQSIVGLMTVALMFAIAITLFHLKVRGNFLVLIPFIVLSITSILGIGLALGGWAKNQQQAAPLSNIVVFPMLFLSGTFFPRFLMPEWLQKISTFLPLTPVIDGLRLITTENKGFLQLGPQITLILAWTVIVYLIAFKVFRWE